MSEIKPFIKSITNFMNATPELFISSLQELYSSVSQCDVHETLATYQTVDTVLSLRGDNLSEKEKEFLMNFRDKVIMARITFFARQGPEEIGRMLERGTGRSAIY